MRNTVMFIAILASMLLLSSAAFCWEWDEVFFMNDERVSAVGDPAPGFPVEALSKFFSTDDDVTIVKLAIFDGGLAVHYHLVNDPIVNEVYRLVTPHNVELMGCPAYMTIAGGNFENPNEYVEAKIVYPF